MMWVYLASDFTAMDDSFLFREKVPDKLYLHFKQIRFNADLKLVGGYTKFSKDGLNKINDEDTYKCAVAERDVLKVLEGDCETAVGAHATIHKNKITLEAELFSLDGKLRFYEKKTSTLNKFKQLGIEVGQSLKTKSNNSYKR